MISELYNNLINHAKLHQLKLWLSKYARKPICTQHTKNNIVTRHCNRQ